MASVASPLSSWSDLKRFFTASPQIDEVLKHSKDSFSETARAAQMLNGRWYVCQMATTPFRNIAALFLQALSSLAAYMNLQSLKTTLKEKITSLQEGFIDKRLANIHIADSSNRYDPKTVFSGETDPEILSIIQTRYVSEDSQIQWKPLGTGVCQGMSIWFLYLYFKTHASFQDPKAHIAFLSSLFTNGAGVEASLLQLFDREKIIEFLDLRINLQRGSSMTDPNTLFFERTDPNALCSLKLQKNTHSQGIINQLKWLPNGAYLIKFPRHMGAYIKTENRSFLLNPNCGVFDFDVHWSDCNLLLHQKLTDLATYYETSLLNKAVELCTGPDLSSSELKNMIEDRVATFPNIEFIPISTAQTFYS